MRRCSSAICCYKLLSITLAAAVFTHALSRLVGVTPFRGESVAELKKHILEGAFVIPEYVSAFAQQLIRRMLEMEPAKRATALELRRTYWLRESKFPESYLQLSLNPDEKRRDTEEVGGRGPHREISELSEKKDREKLAK